MNILSKFRPVVSTYSLFQPLDWCILGLAVFAVIGSLYLWVSPKPGLHVQIYHEGRLYQEIDLTAEKIINVKGPLGITQVEVHHGKARIVKDPSPRQYCVQKGWLEHTGQLAICLPNHTSILIVGRNDQPLYDSLHY